MSKRKNEFNEFTKLVDRVLAVPHTEILRREKEYQDKAAQNPKRRGPKRKVKRSAVGHESGDKG
jgi:hypothetical protein